jgi:uncharacterized protein HemX
VTCPVAGEVVELDAISAERLEGCDIPEGVTFRIHYEETTMDPVAEPETPPTESIEAPTPPASEAPAGLPEGNPVLPTESQAQALSPSDTIDVSQVQALAGDDPMIMLAVLLVMVLGGGAGWKFWTQYSQQRHEQALERLRLERDMAGHGGASPPPCQTAHAALEKRLDALDKRQQETARKLGLLLKQDGPTLDEIDERVVRLEKAARGRA